MGKKLTFLPPLTQSTAQRIIEIRFHLFVNSLVSTNGLLDNKVTSVLESLADLVGVSRNVIVASAIQIDTPGYKPIKQEIVGALAYLNFPIRNIQKLIGISTNTYYKHLQDFIKNQGYLHPKFETERLKVINEFLSRTNTLLTLGMETLKYDKIN